MDGLGLLRNFKLVEQEVAQLGGHRAVDRDGDQVSPAAALQRALVQKDEVLGLFVDLDVAVADHAEKRLLDDRNAAWIDPIEKLLAGDAPTLVVVGAGRDVGELRIRALEDVGPPEQAALVERAREGESTRLRQDRLVQVEERRGARHGAAIFSRMRSSCSVSPAAPADCGRDSPRSAAASRWLKA